MKSFSYITKRWRKMKMGVNKFDLNSFSPLKNYVIEASAGTGKTYNIIQIVDKLVNLYHYDLSSILIVTYTEKAAGELKNRIRNKIHGVDINQASIYTIHSFCMNTIKEFGISAGVPLGLSTISDEPLIAFANQYLRQGKILDEITSFVDADEKYDVDKCVRVFLDALSRYYLDFDYQEDKDIISLEQDEDTRFETWCYKLFRDSRKAEVIQDLFAIPGNEELKRNYEVAKTIINKQGVSFAQELDGCYQQGFNYDGVHFKRTKTMSEEQKEAFVFFSDIKKILKDIKLNKYLCKVYLKDFYIQWQEEKRKNKEQSFDDMIRTVRESTLHNPRFLKKLRDKYRFAIIDEFQDTNQKQFDIFSEIFMKDDRHHIIVVGDPKQSIYSFQGADVNVYYKAVSMISSMPNGEKCLLAKNYRSTPNMVSSCNHLFQFYDFHGTEFVDSEYCTKDVDGDEHEALFDGKEAKAFWIADKDLGLDSRSFAMIAVKKIIDCCSIDSKTKQTRMRIRGKGEKEFRNVTFRDFAVLARTSNEMKDVSNALKNAGIPYLRNKDPNLFTGKECADWIALFETLECKDFTGRNINYYKKSLFTSFFAIPLSKIEVINENDAFSPQRRKIDRWRDIAHEEKWEDLIDDILVSSEISKNLHGLSNMQSFGIFRQIGSVAIEYLSQGHDLSDLIRYLKNLQEGKGEDASATIERSTNFDCVQIMTMHASKGLQFPVVIAVGGFVEPNRQGNVFTFHGPDKHQYLIFEKREECQIDETEEWKRLFYVAYTRAQFVMILPLYEKFGQPFLYETLKNLINQHKEDYLSLADDDRKYDQLQKETSLILQAKEKPQDDSPTQQIATLKQMVSDGPNKKTYIHSYSSLSHPKDEEGEDDEDLHGLSRFDKYGVSVKTLTAKEEPMEFPIDYPKGALIGTILHAIFEKLRFRSYDFHLQEQIQARFEENGLEMKEDWLGPTKIMVENVMNALFPVIHGGNAIEGTFSLNEITEQDRRAEVEFDFNREGERLKNCFNGFIDLLFRRGEYYSIVDWKSDSLNDDFLSYHETKDLKARVDSAYSIQRTLYAYTLIQYLKPFYPELDEEEIYSQHFGGVYYVFLRGCEKNTGNGIYAHTWRNYSELKKSFDEIMEEKVGGKR